ncbi:uncharacterized protein LOC120448168 [Drosophila santomea]|uniref:uncharacterized protein LOC120448168 n=1 Tax=Drosophila santomea TaxID=129105 RepID=UPI0019537D9A|nr:uncharacterized protein LOC120448168 [Drosophila santomea]
MSGTRDEDSVNLEIFKLNTYCWERILSYLSLTEQLHLAASNRQLQVLFETLQHRYRIITESDTANIGETEIQQLLDIVREHVISYETPLDPHSVQEQYLWLLRDYCSNLRHLKMSFRRPRWHDLLQLKSLTSLHVSLHFPNQGMYMDFVCSLRALPHLKKLKLEATSYTGDGLLVLENLESLEIGSQRGFDASILASCCMTMKQLCHLNMGEYTVNLTAEDFRVIVKKGRNLERLAFNTSLQEYVPYEIVYQLPKLKHLQLWHVDFLKLRLIEGLIRKPGTPLESLILVGHTLEMAQVEHICEISSLRELSVSCNTAFTKSLLSLKNLEILDVKMSDVTNDQLLKLLEGCPLLKVFGVRSCRLITFDFVQEAIRLYNRRKIRIYLHKSSVNWSTLPIMNNNSNIQFIKGYLRNPILINKDTCEID